MRGITMTFKRFGAARVIVTVLGFGLIATLSGCEKSKRTSTAGGGASTQSVMTIRGAGQ